MDTRARRLLAGGLALALTVVGVGAGIASSRPDGVQADGQRRAAPQRTDRAHPDRRTTADETDDREGTGDKSDKETPITGDALEKASAAALDYIQGQGRDGTVSETEAGDQESYYEVEITLDSGRQVDVHLDRDFDVLSVDGDGTGP